MFDRIVDQTRPLGLSQPQAKQLLAMLVTRVYSDRDGGPAGFVDHLRALDLNRPLDSWLGPGPNEPMDPHRIDAALGTDHVQHMSERLTLPISTVRAAAATMLPEVIHELSEHGDLPASHAEIPARVHGWFGGHLSDLGHLGSAAFDASAATLGASVGVVGDVPNVSPDTAVGLAPEMDRPMQTRAPGNPGRTLASWLAAVVVLVLGVALIRGCSERERAPGIGSSVVESADRIA
ncbi:MAG: hypothetical protein AVDCRST_MAG71-2077 [uncultured Lysobacter sp.]|uniref:DUF937 domain-containing protein n=1 Tax=uncultured Lysobacter sp. TaxID=271060 RepID=A0A6J4LP05_9GAMM|nr:MAG: hypothetical protein AVDCRST_MAG71-2077 [uncultured Lysobacter sp.]